MRNFISLKTYDSQAKSPMLERGIKAEKRMAYLLKSYFLDDDRVHIINGLRLNVLGDIYVQIDHLIIHTRGIFIIESKSVSTKVKINNKGEWTRFINGKWTGMPSPVHQVERQALLLRKLLQDNREKLRDCVKILGIKKQFGFKNMPIETIIAISEDGIVIRDGEIKESTILKADAVPIFINRRLDEIYPSGIIEHLKDVSWDISHEDIERVIDFLISRHEPYQSHIYYNTIDSSKDDLLVFETNKKGDYHYPKRYFCANCKKNISRKEAYYCFNRKDIFKGKAYCYQCQLGIKSHYLG